MTDSATSSGFSTIDDIRNGLVTIGGLLADRYEILEVLGTGTFGQVCKCLDRDTAEVVAVKIVANGNWIEDISVPREVNILRLLQRVRFSQRPTDERTSMIIVMLFK
jgi:serine/threonine protein kinase